MTTANITIEPVVMVTLTEREAELFVKFQKHYKLFELMDKLNAFNIQFGKITINYAGGNLQNVIKEEVAFKA